MPIDKRMQPRMILASFGDNKREIRIEKNEVTNEAATTVITTVRLI